MGGYFAQFLANKLEHMNGMGTFCREILFSKRTDTRQMRMLCCSPATHNQEEMREITGFPQAWSETFLRENSEMDIVFTQYVSFDLMLMYLFLIFLTCSNQ